MFLRCGCCITHREQGSLKKGTCMPRTLPRVHTTWTGLIAGLLNACKMHGQDVLLQNWSTHSEQPWQVQHRPHFFIVPFTPATPLPSVAGGRMWWCTGREGALTSIIAPCVCFPATMLLDCHCSWELLASCIQPCTNVIRWGCKLRISKGQQRGIEFQSTWLMLFEVAGNFSAFVSFGASEMEPHIFQKCWAPLPRL